jgi:hypothetical protein
MKEINMTKREAGRLPVATIAEVIQRITEALTTKVSFNDQIVYLNVVERFLNRPVESTDNIIRIYDDPIIDNDTIYISVNGIKEGSIQIIQKEDNFYCLFYNYSSNQQKYVLCNEEIYSTGRCIVDIFGGSADSKISHDDAILNLTCGMSIVTAEDYLKSQDIDTKQCLIKYLEAFSDLTKGYSLILARKLINEPEKVKKRLKTYSADLIERSKKINES